MPDPKDSLKFNTPGKRAADAVERLAKAIADLTPLEREMLSVLGYLEDFLRLTGDLNSEPTRHAMAKIRAVIVKATQAAPSQKPPLH